MIRRLTIAGTLGLLLLTTACSSGGSSAVTHPPVTTTGASTTAAPSSTIPGTSAPGTPQTATAASGQQVNAAPTVVQHNGALLTGPAGSWDLGLVVNNVGPGSFQSVPVSQVTLIDSSGQSHAPIIQPNPPPVKDTPQLGIPATLPVGGQVRMLLFFMLPAGTTPRIVTYSPFGAAVPALRWSA